MTAADERPLAVLVLGLALIAGVLSAALPTAPPAVGTPPRPPTATGLVALPDALPAPARGPEIPVADTTDLAPTAVGTRSARLGELDPPAPRAEPVAVRLPDLGVEAPVDDVGVEPDGDMEIPDDVSTVGWYRYGPAPGEDGSAVLAGHVDGRTQGPGALFRLGELHPGDAVHVDMEDGTTRSFTVTARERVAKDAAPLDELFRSSGDPTLVLITCGGAFDAASSRYEDNVLVYAKQLD